MYPGCDPLEGNGLFVLDGEDEELQAALKKKFPREDLADNPYTERDLPFEFKRDVDYFALFDPILPAYQVVPYETEKGSQAAFSNATGPVEVKVGKRQTRSVSYIRYVRAIDPAGNLCQLKVSTCRPSPANKDGYDSSGTFNRVVAVKNAKGWIIVERDRRTWNLDSGKQDQEYAAWALAVMAYRQKRHAAYQALEARAFMSRAERAAEKQGEVFAAAIGAAMAKQNAPAQAAKAK